MKVSALVSLVLAATFVFAGCDLPRRQAGRKPPQTEPRKYDAEFDGPPLAVAVYVDPLLLADQRKISEAAAAAPTVPPPPEPYVAPNAAQPKDDANDGDAPAEPVEKPDEGDAAE